MIRCVRSGYPTSVASHAPDCCIAGKNPPCPLDRRTNDRGGGVNTFCTYILLDIRPVYVMTYSLYIAVLFVSCACGLIIFLLCSVWLVFWLNGVGLVINWTYEGNGDQWHVLGAVIEICMLSGQDSSETRDPIHAAKAKAVIVSRGQ